MFLIFHFNYLNNLLILRMKYIIIKNNELNFLQKYTDNIEYALIKKILKKPYLLKYYYYHH